MAIPIPANLNFVQAAAVPEAFLTAHDALLTQARLAPGESVLVHAAASGVGTAAVQIAHAMGSPVFGTTRTAGKLEPLKQLGVDVAIDTSHASFAEVVKAETQGRGVNVVIDLVGSQVLAANMAALAPKGRLVLVGLMSGSSAPLDMTLMLHKRLTLVGTTLRARPIEEKIAATAKFANEACPWFISQRIRPVVDSVYPFAQFVAAQERLESNQVFGKVILEL